jgi:two-component system sensor histidine kinase UhpB
MPQQRLVAEAPSARDREALRRPRYVSLFWRLFIPNAAVLLLAGFVLWVEPANGRVILLAIGLILMLAINIVLMRRAFAPLAQLNASMRSIDPPAAGTRIEVTGPESEVTVLTRSFNDMLDRLETERRDSARYAMRAQEEERRRIAGELHDSLGQDLTALILDLRAIASDSPPAIRDRLSGSEQQALGIVEDVRRLARQLRPEALDELGLVPALAALCQRMSDPGGLTVRFEPPKSLHDLSSDQELMIYRVAQESLTNAVRHSHGREATVRLRSGGDRDGVVLTVEDDGDGLRRPAGRHGGISGMRERAMLNAGWLSVERSDSGGVRVVLRVDGEEPR